jgi:hypothetical protein
MYLFDFAFVCICAGHHSRSSCVQSWWMHRARGKLSHHRIECSEPPHSDPSNAVGSASLDPHPTHRGSFLLPREEQSSLVPPCERRNGMTIAPASAPEDPSPSFRRERTRGSATPWVEEPLGESPRAHCARPRHRSHHVPVGRFAAYSNNKEGVNEAILTHTHNAQKEV